MRFWSGHKIKFSGLRKLKIAWPYQPPGCWCPWNQQLTPPVTYVGNWAILSYQLCSWSVDTRNNHSTCAIVFSLRTYFLHTNVSKFSAAVPLFLSHFNTHSYVGGWAYSWCVRNAAQALLCLWLFIRLVYHCGKKNFETCWLSTY